jgi:murein DD-endopeptidase MepM/ murein hydrolase activator NlpD
MGALIWSLVASAAVQANDTPIEVFPHLDEDANYVDDFGVFVRERVHMGIDIFSPKGTPVVAVADGFVARLSRGAKAGYYIVLRHADGWESFYMHLNNDLGRDDGRGGWSTAIADGLEAGDYVEAGTIIGYVGDSGNAEHTDPHTHFELHRNGRAVDPWPAVDRAYDLWMLRTSIEQGETSFR